MQEVMRQNCINIFCKLIYIICNVTIAHKKFHNEIICNFKVLLGLVQDETDVYFPEMELRNGISPTTKDQYLRTLVRNTFTFHLNEIFATLQNEYTDWTSTETLSDFTEVDYSSRQANANFIDYNPKLIQRETSLALTDKLYTAPIQQVSLLIEEQLWFPCQQGYLVLYGISQKIYLF